MTPTQLEKRVAVLEAELAGLKRKIEGTAPSKPWWERIAGTFQNDPIYEQSIYEQSMKLGQQYRRSLKPRASRLDLRNIGKGRVRRPILRKCATSKVGGEGRQSNYRAGRGTGRAGKTVGSQAEPGNQEN